MGADAKTGAGGWRAEASAARLDQGRQCVLACLLAWQAYMCLRARGCMSRAERRLGWVRWHVWLLRLLGAPSCRVSGRRPPPAAWG